MLIETQVYNEGAVVVVVVVVAAVVAAVVSTVVATVVVAAVMSTFFILGFGTAVGACFFVVVASVFATSFTPACRLRLIRLCK
jgi:hypothetical protein